ncbi:MAG: PilZ domain-containing protein [Phycisphaerae bacterium]
MFDELAGDAEQFSKEVAFDLMQELEQNTPDELRSQRAHFRMAIKAGVTLQAGNASDMLKFKVQGVTGDVSEGGLGALFPLPPRVGDVYRLEFDQAQLPLPMTFARCVRCVLVREGAYEGGFRFFAPIFLPEKMAGSLGKGSGV